VSDCPPLQAPNLRYLSALTGILYANGYFRIAAVFEQPGSIEPQVESDLWTPDGRQLVLTIGSGPCLDRCTLVIPDVYLLTPTLST
jgi:hypothetical protein